MNCEKKMHIHRIGSHQQVLQTYCFLPEFKQQKRKSILICYKLLRVKIWSCFGACWIRNIDLRLMGTEYIMDFVTEKTWALRQPVNRYMKYFDYWLKKTVLIQKQVEVFFKQQQSPFFPPLWICLEIPFSQFLWVRASHYSLFLSLPGCNQLHLLV